MTGCIGLIGLMGIAVFIALLFVRRKKIEGEMNDFYEAYSLYTTTKAPPNVRESLGGSDNLYACKANLTTAQGEQIEFYWWEWNIKSTVTLNGASSVSYSYNLAVSFAPDSVSDDFVEKTMRLAAQTDASASQKIKDFLVMNTETPYRAEKLADGTFIVCWHILKRRDVYEAKIAWLKNNIILPSGRAADLPDENHASVLTTVKSEVIKSEIGETVPFKNEISGTAFYKNDNYAALRYSFSSAWSNLDLELHHNSGKFDKEGYDELESDASFADPNSPNEILFTLTNETEVYSASRLFEKYYGGHALILRDGISVEERESLAYCNNPFRLPLNVYNYGEFKRRFTERWANLAIELYDTAPNDGGLWASNREFTDDFEMKNLKNADRAFLHDYVFISDWGRSLKNIKIAAAIRNDTLNIYCENDLRDLRLRQFNELKSSG